MPWRRTHLSDAELLLLDEGELTGRRAARSRAHVSRCQGCSARQQRLTATMHAVTQTYRAEQEREPPHTAPSAASTTWSWRAVALPGVVVAASEPAVALPPTE